MSCDVFAALQQTDKFSGVSLHIRRHLCSTHSSGCIRWRACRHCGHITTLCGPQNDVDWPLIYFSCLTICHRSQQLLPPKSSGQQQHTLLLNALPSRAANQIKTSCDLTAVSGSHCLSGTHLAFKMVKESCYLHVTQAFINVLLYQRRGKNLSQIAISTHRGRLGHQIRTLLAWWC